MFDETLVVLSCVLTVVSFLGLVVLLTLLVTFGVGARRAENPDPNPELEPKPKTTASQS